jgi:hypothetical protein
MKRRRSIPSSCSHNRANNIAQHDTATGTIEDTASIAKRAYGNGGFRVEPLRSWARAGQRPESALYSRWLIARRTAEDAPKATFASTRATPPNRVKKRLPDLPGM